MKTYAVLLQMQDADKSRIHRAEHLAYLDAHRGQGHILANGPFVDGWGGLVIYKGESMEEVDKWAQNDPYVLTGARSYEVHEWDMVLHE